MSAIINYTRWLIVVILAALEMQRDEIEWSEFHQDAYEEAAAEFDAIWDSLSAKCTDTPKGIRVTVRRSNGRIARSTLVKAA